MMVATPEPVPVTRPVPAPTVATEVLLLLHVPPVVVSVSRVVKDIQRVEEPVIDDGNGFTVTTSVALQPVVANA